jgi:hypothetical protein
MNRRMAQLSTDRESFRSHWAEVQNYIAPWNGRGLSGDTSGEDTDGSKRLAGIYDSTGIQAAKVLASGMQSGLTSPARPWFRLGFGQFDLGEDNEVKEWLWEVERRMRAVFQGSNVYNALYHVYFELGAFGTGPVAIFENPDYTIQCRPFTAGEYYLATNAIGRVDTLVRRVWMTARQLVDRFGEDKVSSAVSSAYTVSPESRYEVIHFIEPNDSRLSLTDVLDRPFRSVYYEKGVTDSALEVKGYEELPIMAPRWNVVGNGVYGNGPGFDALADVKGLQKLKEKYYIAADKLVEPPLRAPGTLKGQEVNSVPGGITYVDESLGERGLSPLYEVSPQVLGIQQSIQDDRETVRIAFYNDLFKMLSNLQPRSNVTAREIAERHEEKLLQLGPVLERVHTELLNPLIDRTFAIMWRAGVIPEPPEQILGADLRVEYISILAQAQKMVGLTSIESFVGFVGNLAAVDPQVLDKVDLDESIDQYAEAVGVPPTLVVPDDIVLLIRERRAEAAAAQAQGQAALMAAQGAKVMSETDLGGNNALNALMGRQA